MATDLAEFIMLRSGFKLLLGITPVGRALHRRGHLGILIASIPRPEAAGVRGGRPAVRWPPPTTSSRSFAPPPAAGRHSSPASNGDAVYLAAGVLGATVMPPCHLSPLGPDPAYPGAGHGDQRLHSTRVDVAIAMTIAGRQPGR